MKKTIIALFALAGAAAAGTSGWTVSQSDATHITYTTTQTGTFSLASPIADGESFTLTMTFYAESNPFLQGGGLSFLASDAGKGTELYDINGGNDEFRFYVRPGDSIFNFSVNGWIYGAGNDAQTTLSNYTYTAPAAANVSAANPVKFGLTFTYVNGDDAADGNNYFTIAPTADSQIQFDAQTDYNVVRSFNFSNLTNDTASYIDAPADMKTTISITKVGSIPEPTTATLSLLALAGLAARRRRR